MVRFDKRDWLLKDLDFPRSREELLYQLQNDEEISGRIAAAKGLSRHQDEEGRAALLARLRSDPFFGVRQEIVKVLRAAGGEAVRDGLLGAFREEKKSRVRREIVQALQSYPGGPTLAFLRQVIAEDPSYFVVADALRSVAKIDRAGALADAYRALERESYGEEIRTAAIDVIGQQTQLEGREREGALDRLIELHRRGRPIPVRAAAGRALARLGRGVERAYRELADAIDDPSLEMRLHTFGDLGDLGDRRAIEILRNRRGKESHRMFRDPLETIDRAVKQLEGVGDRDQLLDEIRRLREAGEGLERRVKLLESKGGETKGSGRQF
jgi:HEAT repeat protein